jgi:hypothetical protein
MTATPQLCEDTSNTITPRHFREINRHIFGRLHLLCSRAPASSSVLQPAGGHSAVLELGEANREWFSLAGFWSWIAWRSAYLTRLGERPAAGAMCCVPWGPLIIPSATACILYVP